MRIMVIFIHYISSSSNSTEMVFSVDYSITQQRVSNKCSAHFSFLFFLIIEPQAQNASGSRG